MLEIDLTGRYVDPFVTAEVGATYGEYRCSYRFHGGLVDVHLFQDRDGAWLAFLTKAPGVPIGDAQALADAAYRKEAARTGRVAIVMDPYSLPRTGSY